MLVAGQIHGGVAQGMGQALLRADRARREIGQMLTGSFMDYAMPRAEDVPDRVWTRSEVPTPVNPLGAKGVGEAGRLAAPTGRHQRDLDALGRSGSATSICPPRPAAGLGGDRGGKARLIAEGPRRPGGAAGGRYR